MNLSNKSNKKRNILTIEQIKCVLKKIDDNTPYHEITADFEKNNVKITKSAISKIKSKKLKIENTNDIYNKNLKIRESPFLEIENK